MPRNKYHVKKGDEIVVNTGPFKGCEGSVVAILPAKDRVVLELKDMSPAQRDRLGMRTVKPNAQRPQGQQLRRSVSTHVSNVNKLKKGE